ncbi:MAG: hypothetical protein ACOVP5_05065, partial [Chitinophagales bacterium]
GQKFFIGYKLLIESKIELALNILISKGFSRLYVDGQFLRVDDELTNRTITKDKDIYVVIQRVTMINNNDPSEEFYNTVADSTH